MPKGCKKITIEVEDGKMIVSYSSSINGSEFLCKETGEVESLPSVGDFSILWSNEQRDYAIVANVVAIGKTGFISNEGFTYDSAIRFRNYEQFLKVRGIYEDEP